MWLQQQLVPCHVETFLGRVVELWRNETEEFVDVDVGQSTTDVVDYNTHIVVVVVVLMVVAVVVVVLVIVVVVVVLVVV